ncbi:nicotinate phosphoribosyltransferase [Acidithrix sp. C25]|uniref:nicotinate phosphoribosyltransferase n=1 Tax=Acidithrix sp. C25 TaxID=1671482 RepID=UPI00191BC813|nr:nicotinate phosphoribosyltransferase [Acidithrix sp. C25]CAG4924503.1 unnamed protein product [Acidithrix sp. C25]
MTENRLETTALHTDKYEFTMLDTAINADKAFHRAVFEVFTRSLPQGRKYGIVGGQQRLLEALSRFKFSKADISFLRRANFLSERTIGYLESFEFHGTITGLPEGSFYFGGTPILKIEGTFAECLIIETLVLSILNFDSALAAAGERMVRAANRRPIIEMGSRRIHEEAALAAARIGYIVGMASTSNLGAARIYNIPASGTAGHALVMAFENQIEAFHAQAMTLGASSTFLVDTYDQDSGILDAIMACDGEPGAIRIDSGDLFEGATNARQLLDSKGAKSTRIIVTGDLDEFEIQRLRDAPIDGYGVGTRFVIGSGHPSANLVYKLSEIEVNGEMVGVSKASIGKETIPGSKKVTRHFDQDGRFIAESIAPTATESSQNQYFMASSAIDPYVTFIERGRISFGLSIEKIRSFHANQMKALERFVELND